MPTEYNTIPVLKILITILVAINMLIATYFVTQCVNVWSIFLSQILKRNTNIKIDTREKSVLFGGEVGRVASFDELFFDPSWCKDSFIYTVGTPWSLPTIMLNDFCRHIFRILGENIKIWIWFISRYWNVKCTGLFCFVLLKSYYLQISFADQQRCFYTFINDIMSYFVRHTALNISRYNITRYRTQYTRFEGKTSVRLWSHEIHPYLALTGEL